MKNYVRYDGRLAMQQVDYINNIKKIGVYSGEIPYEHGSKINTTVSQMGMNYKDKAIHIMHLEKLGDIYIYDEYLKVILYMYNKINADDIKLEDVYNDYNSASNVYIDKLMDFYQKGGCKKTNHYLLEISKGHKLCCSKDNNLKDIKNLENFAIEDYKELEKWIKDNSTREEFPIIYGEE